MVSNGLQRLAGTYFAPKPSLPMPSWPAIEQMPQAGVTALAAPPDFLDLGKVAMVVRERYAQVLWIRLQVGDSDPGAMLATLLGAAATLDLKAPQQIAEVAARHARLGEWRTAYKRLADWLADATIPPTALVLEGVECLGAGSPASLDLLISGLAPYLPGRLAVVLIGFTEWNCRRVPPYGPVLGRSKLRLDRRCAALISDAVLPDLPSAVLDRSYALSCGGAGALHAAFSAGAVLGQEVFCAITAQVSTGKELLAALARRLLASASEDTFVILAEASRLGIWHPALASALGIIALNGQEPWWLDLGEGWRQLMPVWHAPLRSAGRTRAANPAYRTLLADYLASQGVKDRAFELYLEAEELDRAADTAVGLARDLADTGSWTSLARIGQALAHRSLTAGLLPESDEPAKHSTRWWRRRLVRMGRQPSGQMASAQATRPLPFPAVPVIIQMPAADLTAHLFGELRVAFRDRPVEIWASGRGRAVFEYLLFNRHSRVRRDRLMSVFWPEVSPDAARNSLNVAIHGLRQSLRAVAGDTAVVIHQDQAYFIEPTLDVWVDVEVFEEQLKTAHQLLASADRVQAEAAFEAATSLYQGEFLADDPYEEWAIVTREHLRLCYLDALDRLGAMRLNSGDYVGCVAVSLKLLGYDGCREDAHCRLMRCYSRQGQVQLALRQYNSCAAALHAELNVAPAPATTDLFDRIRRREVV